MLDAPSAGERVAGSADLPAPAEAVRAAEHAQPLVALAAASDTGAESIDRADNADNADKPPSPLAPSGDSAAAAALLSKQEAEQRLGGKVLAVLQAKFNGCLTDIRLPDEHDLLF